MRRVSPVPCHLSSAIRLTFILVCIVPEVKELPRLSFWSLSLQIRNVVEVI